MAYETIPIEKICRTCLSPATDLRSVFSIDEPSGESLRLFEMLMCCASVQVKEQKHFHLCLWLMSRTFR